MRVILLLLISFNLCGQGLQSLTVGEAYNFEVGDTTQYIDNKHEIGLPYQCKLLTKTILSKQYTSNADTLIYQMQVNEVFRASDCIFNSHTTVSDYTENVVLTNLDSVVFLSYRRSSSFEYKDTTYISAIFSGKRATDASIYFINSTAVENLGRTKHYMYCESCVPKLEMEEDLVFYHRSNGEKWGLPQYITALSETIGRDILSVYSNDDKLIVHLPVTPSLPTVLTVCDMTGRLVYEYPLHEKDVILDNVMLAKGMYVWSVSGFSDNKISGKIFAQ